MVTLNKTDASLWGRNPADRQALVTELIEKVGVIVTRKQVRAFLESTGRHYNDVTWLFNNRRFRAARGQYTLQPALVDNSGISATSVN